jgi:hypothetical protein
MALDKTQGDIYTVAGITGNDLPNWVPVAAPGGLASALSLLTVDTTSTMLLAATTVVDPSSAPAIYAMQLPATSAAPSGSWVASPMPPATVGLGIGAVTVFPGVAVLAGVGNRVFVGSIAGATAPLQWQDADPLLQFQQLGVVEALHFSADFSQFYACSGVSCWWHQCTDPANNQWNAHRDPYPPVPFNCAGMASGVWRRRYSGRVATSAGVYLSSDGASFTATQSLGVSPVAKRLRLAAARHRCCSSVLASASRVSRCRHSRQPLPGAPTTVPHRRGVRGSTTPTPPTSRRSARHWPGGGRRQYADVLTSTDAGAT